jgi:hypothetical protein
MIDSGSLDMRFSALFPRNIQIFLSQSHEKSHAHQHTTHHAPMKYAGWRKDERAIQTQPTCCLPE